MVRFVDLGEVALAEHISELEDIVLYLLADRFGGGNPSLAFKHR